MSCCTQQKRCFTLIPWRHSEFDHSSFMLFPFSLVNPRIVSFKDCDLFRVVFMTDLSLLSISAISFYLLGNNVTSCHRRCTHCHHSNSVDLLIVLIIRNTDDKSWDANFHLLWQDFIVQMRNIYCLYTRCIIFNGVFFFFNHSTHSTAAVGKKKKSFKLTKVYKRKYGRNKKQQFN